MNISKVSRAIALVLIFTALTGMSLQNLQAADSSTLSFYWSDNESTDLNRTFSEDEVTDSQPSWWFLDVNTQDKTWEGLTLYLEKFSNGKWTQLMWAPLYGFTGERPGLNASFTIDGVCGGRVWCSGIQNYRIKSKDVILKEFQLRFVPKKSNLRITLKTDREQSWGSQHLLTATVTPRVSVKCTVERNGENIGNLYVKNGSGSMKFTALAYQKPSTGRTIVTLYTVCKAGKYYGASELGFLLFVP